MKATVLRYGPLGASVSVAPAASVTTSPIVIVDTNQQQMGLILQDQIEYWAALNKRDPQVGEVLNAYIQKVLFDASHIVLRHFLLKLLFELNQSCANSCRFYFWTLFILISFTLCDAAQIRDDGKMDIALRPVGYDKVTTARDQ